MPMTVEAMLKIAGSGHWKEWNLKKNRKKAAHINSSGSIRLK